MAGMGGVPLAGAYTATKAAVVALTEAWALELASTYETLGEVRSTLDFAHLHLRLELPDGWVVLRPGNPLVAAPEEALVTIAQPRLEGYGYVAAEPAPWAWAAPAPPSRSAIAVAS